MIDNLTRKKLNKAKELLNSDVELYYINPDNDGNIELIGDIYEQDGIIILDDDKTTILGNDIDNVKIPELCGWDTLSDYI